MKRSTFFSSSFTRRLMKSYLIVIIPLISISVGATYMSLMTLRDQITRAYSDSFEFLSRNLDGSLSKLRDLARALQTDQDLLAAGQSPHDSVEVLLEYVELLGKLKFLSLTNELESSLTVFLFEKDRYLSSDQSLHVLSQQIKAALETEYHLSTGTWSFRHSIVPDESPDVPVLAYYSRIPDRTLAVSVEVPEREVLRLLESFQTGDRWLLFLTDGAGAHLSSSRAREPVLDAIMRHALSQHDTNTVREAKLFSVDGASYLGIAKRLESEGLVLGMYTPEDIILQPIASIRYLLIVVLFVSLTLSFLYSFLAYRNVLRPIQSLFEGMQQVKEGNFKVRIPEDETEDFGLIEKQFNHMTSRIEALIEEVNLEHMKYQRAQLKFLQSQVNPHFLYNCLYFMYQLSAGGPNDAVAKMALYLGTYFRYTSRMGRSSVTVGEELELVQNYLAIQNLRFQDCVVLHVLIDEELEKEIIPPLVIQPVVENAFKYGFEGLNKSGNIWIHVHRTEGGLAVRIENDGESMDEERLRTVSSMILAIENESGSTGLHTINWRLRLRYGNEAGVKLERRSSGGLVVEINLPDKEKHCIASSS